LHAGEWRAKSRSAAGLPLSRWRAKGVTLCLLMRIISKVIAIGIGAFDANGLQLLKAIIESGKIIVQWGLRRKRSFFN
jgi:hypothetical protein